MQSIVKNTATAKLRTLIIDSLDGAGAPVALVQANISIGGSIVALVGLSGTCTQVGSTPQHKIELTQAESDLFGVSEPGFVAIEAASGAIPVSFPFMTFQSDIGVTPPTAGDVADAVWDEVLAGHTTAGTAGKVLADVLTGVTAVAATLAAGVLVGSGSITAIRDAILNWTIWTGWTLAKALRSGFTTLLGTKTGGGTGTEVFTAPAGGGTVTSTTDANNNRSSVVSTESGTP